MNSHTRREQIPGPAGVIECAIDLPAGPPRALAVICHPHPQHGGTMDNKVAQTLARAFVMLGFQSVRFNFRGVGGSQGAWDDGRGEIDDALAVVAATRVAGGPLVPAPMAVGLPLILAGFSFGGYVVSQAAQRLPDDAKAKRLVLIAPATSRFDVAAVPEDTLVVHGDADDVVPLSATLDWARPQSLPVTVVPGGGHFFHGALPLLRTLVMRAFVPPPV